MISGHLHIHWSREVTPLSFNSYLSKVWNHPYDQELSGSGMNRHNEDDAGCDTTAGQETGDLTKNRVSAGNLDPSQSGIVRADKSDNIQGQEEMQIKHAGDSNSKSGDSNIRRQSITCDDPKGASIIFKG